jgi:hypothetical protein
VGTEQLDAEVVETMAGVVRLLRRAAALAWAQAEGAPRSSRQQLALGSSRQQTRYQACYLAGLGWTGLRR